MPIFITAISIITGVAFIPVILYIVSKFIRIKPLEPLFCKLSWHSHQYDGTHHKENDPLQFLVYAKCQWCGFEGQIDSQGNLF